MTIFKTMSLIPPRDQSPAGWTQLSEVYNVEDPADDYRNVIAKSLPDNWPHTASEFLVITLPIKLW
jgi:hypothetical protein